MSKGNAFEAEVIAYVFHKTPMPDHGDYLYVALYTASPGEDGLPNTNETAYTNYARQSVILSEDGWTLNGSEASNAAVIAFPECGAIPGPPITHVAIVTSASGSGGQIRYYNALETPLVIATQMVPALAIGDITTSED